MTNILNNAKNEKHRKLESIFHKKTTGKFIGDLVYGANDGIITTFAVVAGAAGASLSPAVVLILGFANLVADGLSMGASNYLSKKSETDYAKAQREKENWEIENLPALEIEEIREIFTKKGFTGKDLERATEIVTSNKQVWLETMMRDELGIIIDEHDDPKIHGILTFLSFVLAGLVPLLPYLFSQSGNNFVYSYLFGIGTLFIVGSLRSLVSVTNWIKSGLEMLLIGSLTAFVAYQIGSFIEQLVSS